jgi:hypothetical protein
MLVRGSRWETGICLVIPDIVIIFLFVGILHVAEDTVVLFGWG